MSNSFIVSDFGELLALQCVFREAKFGIEPDDVDISDSPIVARLFERLIETLIAQELAINGEDAKQRWTRWLEIDESRDEWDAAVERAKADERWHEFSSAQRKEYVRLLLSPFILSPNIFDRFILAVDNSGA